MRLLILFAMSGLLMALPFCSPKMRTIDCYGYSTEPRSPDSLTIFEEFEVEQPPAFPGGPPALLSRLSRSLVLPADCSEGLGKTVLSFVVERDGRVAHVEVLKTPHACMDTLLCYWAENLPPWKPATHRGVPVRVHVLLPLYLCGR